MVVVTFQIPVIVNNKFKGNGIILKNGFLALKVRSCSYIQFKNHKTNLSPFICKIYHLTMIWSLERGRDHFYVIIVRYCMVLLCYI